MLWHVIKNNDRKGLEFYYHLAADLTSQKRGERGERDDGENDQVVIFPQWAFLLAVKDEHIELLRDMIKWTGAGLPLEHLVKETGIELQEKPRYYQGLTVYGKKRCVDTGDSKRSRPLTSSNRKDWAAAGRGIISQSTPSGISPLLYAAREGNEVEFFLTDAPLRCYLEFSKSRAAKEDVRLNHLNQSPWWLRHGCDEVASVSE